VPSTRKTSQQADADIFTAIAHPVRRQLLDLLVRGELTVTDLAQPFAEDKSRSAISQHLKILLDSGLVALHKRGREHYYHLRPENLNVVYAWIKQYERFWPEKLAALGDYLDRMTHEEPDGDAARPEI
jgi:DNA-binding transcriptional ArsR family regulator